ncbi:hypothetical protein [Anaerobiospirillum sp. NML120449]|uniref:hypothetical protein n=1 Tax=Anaerobiospirillum sp. NML120449 TaxID=2932817 RepID=UPI001FF2810B|nr:hypothetical protein [Anaerobiospirillum sp. NML120449]MCK0525857.1 hypothetical protein [Anaerobiospirillum sp. NML120449]
MSTYHSGLSQHPATPGCHKLVPPPFPASQPHGTSASYVTVVWLYVLESTGCAKQQRLMLQQLIAVVHGWSCSLLRRIIAVVIGFSCSLLRRLIAVVIGFSCSLLQRRIAVANGRSCSLMRRIMAVLAVLYRYGQGT